MRPKLSLRTIPTQDKRCRCGLLGGSVRSLGHSWCDPMDVADRHHLGRFQLPRARSKAWQLRRCKRMEISSVRNGHREIARKERPDEPTLRTSTVPTRFHAPNYLVRDTL